MINCLKCNDKFKTVKGFKSHLKKQHKFSNSDIIKYFYKNSYVIKKCSFCNNNAYYKLIWQLTDDNYLIIKDIKYPSGLYCKTKDCPGKKLNPVSKEFLKKAKGLSDEDIEIFLSKKAKRGVNTNRKNNFYLDPTKNCSYKEYWKNKGYSETYIDKKFKNRAKKSIQTLRDKGWYLDKSNNPYSKEFWKKRGYSDNEALLKIKERQVIQKEYWIKHGFSKKDAIELAKNNAKTNSLEYNIKKYGEIKGLIKYEKTCQKLKDRFKYENLLKRFNGNEEKVEEYLKKLKKSTFKNSKFSKISQELFHLIYERLPIELQEKTYYATLNHEYGRYDNINKKYYLYDFVISNIRICIEFNGVLFHPNKDKLSITEWNNWKQFITYRTADEIYEIDSIKKDLLIKDDYTYIVIWEDEYIKNKKEVINFIIKKILDKWKNIK